MRERIFHLWHREESRFRPARDDLARRFRGLVGRLGGEPEASAPVFDRLFRSWSADSRRYHDVEHLVDCLRELEGSATKLPAADIAEAALWYHDVVYEPLATDCEERSARALLADAAVLSIPHDTAATASELVRSTAHRAAAEICSPIADLVVDIDLSILGRDVLRFMDYEYGVEEEYASISTLRFRVGRGRFLASLIARPYIFRTELFRAKYEQSARAQIAAVLGSRRYRSFRWLRWLANPCREESQGNASSSAVVFPRRASDR